MSRILFLVPHPAEDSGNRYRVRQFVPCLEQAGHRCTVWPFATSRLYAALRDRGRWGAKAVQALYASLRRVTHLARCWRFDLVVIHREVFPFFMPWLERAVLMTNRKVIFSFDDAIYAGHENVSELNHPRLYRLKYGAGVNELIRRSAHVIAGNRILAAYAQQFNSRVSIIPTVVDCEQYSYHPKPPSDRLTVGWVGSRSTAPYLSLVEPALRQLARVNAGRVRFRFIGHPEYRPALPDMESLPFTLAREIEDLRTMDIGIMPLPDTEWTRGKCAFKAIQYMALGIPTVASPVGITPDLIRNQVNGWLATSPQEWFAALHRLVNDADLRQRFSGNARQTIEEEYSLQAWEPRLLSIVDRVLKAPVSAAQISIPKASFGSSNNKECHENLH